MDDLKLIKKYYGEKMMHFCRYNFSTLLDQKNSLFNLLKSKFAYNKELYFDIKSNDLLVSFKDYIYSFYKEEKSTIKVEDNPYELFDKAGYILYQCNSKAEIKSFEKYYSADERLCTFDQDRLKYCYVFFAVKKNVDEIKRENFLYPKREDKYGTSVLSIQFARGKVNNISIKNRYNHSVNNPDATYGNNLDNIIPGLEYSFKNHFDFNFKSDSYTFDIPGYVKAIDNKYYKYNYEMYNIYYCPGNMLVHNHCPLETYKKESSRYILMDYFLLDLKEKKMSFIDEYIDDSFIDFFKKINKIKINKNKIDNVKKVYIELINKKSCIITLDNNNRIIGYENPYLTTLNKKFLVYNTTLRYLKVDNVKTIESDVMRNNKEIVDLTLPNVVSIKDYFLNSNNKIISVDMPNLKSVGAVFMCDCENLEYMNFPSLRYIGDHFMARNKKLTIVDLPSVISVGNSFISSNNIINVVNMSKLEKMSFSFLSNNTELTSLSFPKLKNISPYFLMINKKLVDLYIPKVKNIDYISVLLNNEKKNEFFETAQQRNKRMILE